MSAKTSAKLSQGVTDRMRSCRFLLAALRRQGPKIAAKVADAVRPNLGEGEATPDPWPLLRAFAGTLKAALDRLLRADVEVFEENVRRRRLMDERKLGARELGDRIRALRNVVAGLGRAGRSTPSGRPSSRSGALMSFFGAVLRVIDRAQLLSDAP